MRDTPHNPDDPEQTMDEDEHDELAYIEREYEKRQQALAAGLDVTEGLSHLAALAAGARLVKGMRARGETMATNRAWFCHSLHTTIAADRAAKSLPCLTLEEWDLVEVAACQVHALALADDRANGRPVGIRRRSAA